MQSNREVVIRYLEAMHVGDLNVVADCVSEDVTRYGPRPTSKYAPPVHGREAFLAAYHGPEYFQMGTLSMERTLMMGWETPGGILSKLE